MERIVTQIDGDVATVTLNRPELHNAFDHRMIAELASALESLAARPEVGIVQLAAAGESFSAGADLDWMRRMAAMSEEENRADAERLARLLHLLATLPKPDDTGRRTEVVDVDAHGRWRLPVEHALEKMLPAG